jgi:hypothetical protein
MNRPENNSGRVAQGIGNCEAVRDNLPLYWYGELAAETESGIERHLAGCGACAQEWEQWKRTFAALDQDVLEPRAELLAECRAELRDSLRRDMARLEVYEHSRSGFSQWWQRVRAGFVLRPFPAIAGAAAMLAVGFFASRAISPGGMLAGQTPGEERVRYVLPGADGRVRLVLEQTREREVEGRMEDEAIRGLLVRAAQNSSDPGLRVETVELLNRESGDFDVRSALLAVLERDPNAGVRQKAIEGLKAYAHEDEVRRALSAALLRDDDPGIRMQAIDTLMRLGRPDTVGVLQESIGREQNDDIRQRTVRALQAMNASAGTF